jgi:hypothetical protein
METLPFPLPDPSSPLDLYSTPDASSPTSTSPTPVTIPIPATNHLSSSPASAGPSACGGRSIAQRWSFHSAEVFEPCSVLLLQAVGAPCEQVPAQADDPGRSYAQTGVAANLQGGPSGRWCGARHGG